MVLANHVRNFFTELMQFGKFDAEFHMGKNNQTAHAGRKLVMGIDSVKLIFTEIVRMAEFSDIMVQCPDFRQ